MTGETLLEMKVNRRMMGSIETTAGQLKNGTRKTITRAKAPSPAAAPAPAPAAGHDALS
ncbi:hypothetical protein BHE74_00004008 [Ensete ventricosum]|nr:hypothetical protein GW17_00062245 [Ensete ventricosum]RWW87180.1 hypothetical protein BHE74_00004008 [Ensete ventricosum]